MVNSPFGLTSPFFEAPFHQRDPYPYRVNGLSPVLVMDFENGVFKSNACPQYAVNGIFPALVMNFTAGEYYQKDCA